MCWRNNCVKQRWKHLYEIERLPYITILPNADMVSILLMKPRIARKRRNERRR